MRLHASVSPCRCGTSSGQCRGARAGRRSGGTTPRPGIRALAFVTGGLAGAGLSGGPWTPAFHAHARFFRRRGGRSRDVRVGHSRGPRVRIFLYMVVTFVWNERGSGFVCFRVVRVQAVGAPIPGAGALLQRWILGALGWCIGKVWHSARWCAHWVAWRPDAQEDFWRIRREPQGPPRTFRERASRAHPHLRRDGRGAGHWPALAVVLTLSAQTVARSARCVSTRMEFG